MLLPILITIVNESQIRILSSLKTTLCNFKVVFPTIVFDTPLVFSLYLNYAPTFLHLMVFNFFFHPYK